jgi:D-sedoheptulose 7-phosphate isomerase
MSILNHRFNELAGLIPRFEFESGTKILEAANLIVQAFKQNNKILICGNGGSAADSQHLAAEFVNAFSKDLQRKSLSAIALTTDTSVLTSISNDFDFTDIFARQVEAHSNLGDVLIVLTTSGSSKNCIKAVEQAKKNGIKSIAFTRTGGKIGELSDISIMVPSDNTQHIQECHMLAYHVITEIVEETLFRGVTP